MIREFKQDTNKYLKELSEDVKKTYWCSWKLTAKWNNKEDNSEYGNGIHQRYKNTKEHANCNESGSENLINQIKSSVQASPIE